jgi:hypothetical protein
MSRPWPTAIADKKTWFSMARIKGWHEPGLQQQSSI